MLLLDDYTVAQLPNATNFIITKSGVVSNDFSHFLFFSSNYRPLSSIRGFPMKFYPEPMWSAILKVGKLSHWGDFVLWNFRQALIDKFPFVLYIDFRVTWVASLIKRLWFEAQNPKTYTYCSYINNMKTLVTEAFGMVHENNTLMYNKKL
jgi:hypothetical protein